MAAEHRPNPDALLAHVKAEEGTHGCGRLKVYLGMAAGVGKTYTMLADAQQERERGLDVVIGYLEPHGRPETEAMAEGMEFLPLRSIEHKGVTLREFDLDAAIARRPALLLVDELAHTNAPGSRHRKRWQDVQELIQSGINVATTVNIQHLESLNDVVAQITTVIVSETVPDVLINSANEVELVDLPPDDLIQRLRDGKVYVPEKIEQALGSFFKKGNLLALRELALRHTAERVDEQVRTYRAAEGKSQPWHTRDRVLVCIAPNQLGTKVVRAGCRLATNLHADLIAIYVDSSRQSSVNDTDRARAREALRMAEELGAETVILTATDIVAEVIRVAQMRNVTTIVVGKPLRPRWRELLFGSVVDELVRASGNIDVHVISGDPGSGIPVKLPRATNAHDIRGYVMAVVSTFGATVLALLLDNYLVQTNLAMVYLLSVTYIAGRHSRRAAVLASVLSVACFDYFLVPPQGTFAVSDLQYLFTFGAMLVVALLIATLTARLREQSLAASRRERRTAALYDLSKKLSSTRSRQEIGLFAASKVRDVFGGDVTVMIRSRQSGEMFMAPESTSGFEKAPNELAVSQWVLEHGKPAGKGTDTLPGSVALYLPLNAETGCVGVLGLVPEADTFSDPGRMHLLETFANQLAVAIERTNLAKDSHQASIQVERERLRNSLLSSVSHDLRTPLSVISGAAESLRSQGHFTEARDHELVDAIAEEAARLSRQVRNLLDMTRMESGAVELNRDWHSVEELVGSALARSESLLIDHDVSTDIPGDLPLVKVDGTLIEQVLVNLLENAARYTPAGTHIDISGRAQNGVFVVTVANDGPSLEPGDEERIFAKFHRAKTSQASGFGLGLAICRAILEAHGGTIIAANREPRGVRFILTLPIDVAPPEVPLD